VPKRTSPPIEAAGVVLIHPRPEGDRVLLLRNRRQREWGLPKGHLEAGEDVFTAARRELLEETGIREFTLEPGFRHRVRYKLRTKNGALRPKKVTYYLGRAGEDSVVLSDEHDDFRWATEAEAARSLPHENLRALVREAFGYLRALRP
jgi:8-oxo-dGTP pyrophosphatase MutT (NUDIX family)